MFRRFRSIAAVFLVAAIAMLAGLDAADAQLPKEKAAPKQKKGSPLAADPIGLKPGQELSSMAIVVHPPIIKGAVSWTIESRRHRSEPSSFSISPDGATAATAGYDGTIHLWDLATGKLLRVLMGHDSSVHGVAFSPDGTLIASAGSFDETARVWNAKTGMVVRVLKKHKGFTSGVTWSPDGTTLAVSGGNSGFVTFWDPINNKQLHTIEHGNRINGVAWSPDGKTLACATDQGAFLWKAEDGANLGTVKVAGNRALAVGWSPDSAQLLVGAMRTVDVWDIALKKVSHSLSGTGWVVGWSPDGKTVATSFGGGMHLWNGKTLAQRKTLEVPARAFGWDNKTGALYAVTAHDIHALDVEDIKKPQTFPVADADTLIWTAGHPVVSGVHEKTLKLWDLPTGKPLATLTGHTDEVTAVAWTRDGKLLASGGKDLTARVWDAKSGKLLRTLAVHHKPVKAVAWSMDGRLATACEDKMVRVFTPDDDKPIELKGHTHPATALVWRDSKTLISGGEDGKIITWDIENGKPAQTIAVEHDVWAISLSPDGSSVACGGNDDVARVYSLGGGKLLHSLDPKMGPAEFFNLAWSPDGSLLATTNYRMLLWNAKSEKQLHGYQMGGAAHTIGFPADGKTTVAGCLDRVIRLCDTAQGALRGTIVRDQKQLVAITAEGAFKAPGEIDSDFVFVVQTDKSQDVYDSKTFQTKFGWRNNPNQVKFTDAK